MSSTTTIRYSTSLAELTPQNLTGFFEGWSHPPSPEDHLRILRGSSHCVLAIDDRSGQIVGFINALTDGTLSAFIPLLKVLPAYRHRGIGRQLVQQMLALLTRYRCIDLTCDPHLQPFYQTCGMSPSTAMILRHPRP